MILHHDPHADKLVGWTPIGPSLPSSGELSLPTHSLLLPLQASLSANLARGIATLLVIIATSRERCKVVYVVYTVHACKLRESHCRWRHELSVELLGKIEDVVTFCYYTVLGWLAKTSSLP